MSATPTSTYGAPASPGTMTTPDETRRVREERIHNARATKAKTLALYMRSQNISADVAARLSDGGWSAAGHMAGVRLKLSKHTGPKTYNKTVSLETRSAVVALLSILEDLDELSGDG
jgi:hypothetical protein